MIYLKMLCVINQNKYLSYEYWLCVLKAMCLQLAHTIKLTQTIVLKQ